MSSNSSSSSNFKRMHKYYWHVPLFFIGPVSCYRRPMAEPPRTVGRAVARTPSATPVAGTPRTRGRMGRTRCCGHPFVGDTALTPSYGWLLWMWPGKLLSVNIWLPHVQVGVLLMNKQSIDERKGNREKMRQQIIFTINFFLSNSACASFIRGTQ